MNREFAKIFKDKKHLNYKFHVSFYIISYIYYYCYCYYY